MLTCVTCGLNGYVIGSRITWSCGCQRNPVTLEEARDMMLGAEYEMVSEREVQYALLVHSEEFKEEISYAVEISTEIIRDINNVLFYEARGGDTYICVERMMELLRDVRFFFGQNLGVHADLFEVLQALEKK